MKLHSTTLRTSLLAIAAASLVTLASAQDDALLEAGAGVYAQQCAACHQPTGEGMPGVFPALAGNDFVTGDPHPVIDVVLHGRAAMPPFGAILDDDEIAAVVTYIRQSWDNDADAVTGDDVQERRAAHDAGEDEAADVELEDGWQEAGAQLFASNCSACHQPQGQGIPGAFPPLAGNPFVLGDPHEVVRVILDGRGGMPSFRGQMNDTQIAHVTSFIRTAWENDASLVAPDTVGALRAGEEPSGTPAAPTDRPGAGN